MDRLRERVARELFDIWKEAKSTTPEPWDDVQWETLSENAKGEYYKTAQRILSFIRAEVKGIENPCFPVKCVTGVAAYQGAAYQGFEQARQAVLKVLGE